MEDRDVLQSDDRCNDCDSACQQVPTDRQLSTPSLPSTNVPFLFSFRRCTLSGGSLKTRPAFSLYAQTSPNWQLMAHACSSISNVIAATTSDTLCESGLTYSLRTFSRDTSLLRSGIGVELSGGQKQYLAITRAKLRNLAILILDETTSALNTTSRILVFEALKRWCANKITIVITHDLCQISQNDFVYFVFEKFRKMVEAQKALEAEEERKKALDDYTSESGQVSPHIKHQNIAIRTRTLGNWMSNVAADLTLELRTILAPALSMVAVHETCRVRRFVRPSEENEDDQHPHFFSHCTYPICSIHHLQSPIQPTVHAYFSFLQHRPSFVSTGAQDSSIISCFGGIPGIAALDGLLMVRKYFLMETSAVKARFVAKCEIRNKRAKEEVAGCYCDAISYIRGLHRWCARRLCVKGCTYGVASGLIYVAEALLFYVGAVVIARGMYTYFQMVEVHNLVVPSVTIGSQLLVSTEKVDNNTDESRDILLLTLAGTVVFNHVCFVYYEHPVAPVLKDVNLEIEDGESVTIVGFPGSGELTGNIRYGNKAVTAIDICRAANAANGYGTMVGENAFLISGSQAQRHPIAHTLAPPSEILILNKRTATLDSENQARLPFCRPSITPNLVARQ
ncbi:P-loop containing nucleoside triphosphate hydrolase protein [Crucibulum laeve]|uniref:P-loop containing nucleoside triphosphate hydrolase protein n=1 Tax=Crucibulum laeve TaxID=68775 RepID=A0A5C3LEG6_9AGAR|nr:P-loop containing nucleoside triphosphate hydrolase protein [Crucibulum laeve]